MVSSASSLRPGFVAATKISCPHCFWDEAFSNQFELEWHVLKCHGKRMYLALVRNRDSSNQGKHEFVARLKSFIYF